MLLFALGDVATKYLTERYPVSVVIAMRYLVSLALLLALAWPRVGSALWRTERTWLVVLRGGVLSLASLTLGLALRVMPVGETVAIMYLAPFAVMALAVPLLGERVTPLGWLLAVLGFGGVLLILRPGSGLDGWGVAFALANAVCATVFHLMTRQLSATESAISMLFHVTLVGAVAFTLAALPNLDGPLPGPTDLGLMALLGVLATSGHFLFSLAYREAPASLVAPVNYLHLVWAALLGWVFFSHVPDATTLLGMGLIVLSGASIAFKAHVDQRGAARRERRARAQAHVAPE